MATPIRPEDLPAVPGGTVPDDAAIIVDIGTGVNKATPPEVVESGIPATLGIPGGSAKTGYAQAGSSPRPQTSQEKLRRFVDLIDWKLGSDTDYTSAFGRAIERLDALGGGVLRIPRDASTMDISDEIEVASNIEIVGQGFPYLRQVTAAKRAFWGSDCKNVGFRGFKLEGGGSGTPFTSGANDGLIDFTATTPGGSSDIFVRECELFGAPSLVALPRTDRGVVERNYLHNWMLYGSLQSESANSKCDNNWFITCDQTGAVVAYACQATGNNSAGFPVTDFSFCGNYVEGVKSWDAFMSHAGEAIKACFNVIRDCRNGIDITTEDDPVVAPIVEDNDITATDTDTWSAAAAAHFAVAVRAENGSDTITGASVCRNTARNFGVFQSSGVALGVLSFENIAHSTIADNNVLGFDPLVTGYRPIAITKCGDGVTIEGNRAEGASQNNEHMINVSQAGGGDSCSGLSIRNNRMDLSGTPANIINLTNGAYNDLSVAGNVGSPTRLPYDLNGTTPTVSMAEGPADFTPGLSFSVSDSGLTLLQQQGSYEVKDGRVWVNIYIRLSAIGSASGNATVTGLPFQASSKQAFTNLASYGEDMTAVPAGLIAASASVVTLVNGAGTGANITQANFTNNSIMAFSGFYEAA